MNKLLISFWGASISAEGGIAIIAAVTIAGLLAMVVTRRA